MNSKNRIWLLAFALGTIGVLALGWFVGISPRLAETAAADEQREQVELTNAQYERQLAQLKKDAEGIDGLRAELAELGLKFPAQPGDEDLLSALEAYATGSGVVLNAVTWSDGRLVSAEAANGDAPSSGLAPDGALVALPVVVDFTGSYAASQEFIRKVQEVSARHILVAGFSYTVSETGVDNYRVSLSLILFMIVDSEANAPAEPTEEAPAEEEPTEDEEMPTPAPTETTTP